VAFFRGFATRMGNYMNIVPHGVAKTREQMTDRQTGTQQTQA